MPPCCAIILRHPGFLALVLALFCRPLPAAAAEGITDFTTLVAPILAAHCLDCHAAQDPEGKLVLESFDTLRKGGESGAAIVPGKSAESLLIKMVTGSEERDGKKKIMPPGKRKKLGPEEIASLRRWVDAGAPPPVETASVRRELVLPKLTPRTPPHRSIQALAFAPSPKLLAVARYGEVDLVSAESHAVVRTLRGHRGSVNAVAFSSDGKLLAAAAGEPALFGETRLWEVESGTLMRTLVGHKDALYAVAISPDGKRVATGSYDQKIKLWDLATGQELQTLSAHNGGIFGLAFRPNGRILASASGDRTIKLWNVETGKRVETLSQPLKEQYTVAWSPDGKRLFAAGADNRIRVWEISDSAAEGSNPLLLAKFAHEGAILNLAVSSDGKSLLSSADDRALKVWEAATLNERRLLEAQPDLTPALAFLDQGKTAAAGRLDGSLEFYDLEQGRRLPPPAPELRALEPRGLQRGTHANFRLRGKNLAGVTNVLASHADLDAELSADGRSDTELRLTLSASSSLARGDYEISVTGPGGASGKLKLFVDDLPQVPQVRPATNATASTLPADFWGALDSPGRIEEFAFEARQDETIVLDLAIKRIGSKIANGSLALLDAQARVLATARGFDGGDRFLAFRIPATGRYVARVSDEMLGASPDHFFRLSAGALPYVTGVFPLSVATNAETEVELTGVNLPPKTRARLRAGAPGEMEVPIDPNQFRSQRAFTVLVAPGAQEVEMEPNDHPAHAGLLHAPGVIQGRIQETGDVDLFRFEAQAGQAWVLETDAARRGSPIDTRLEVLHPDGRPVGRLLLQAVRNTAINFRGVDANSTGMRLDNYEEMELNEFLYVNGEVMQLFRMPQGPDSEMMMYTLGGKRRGYFDTTVVGHALDEVGYIVDQQPLGAKLAANGLPIFTLHYENDDDSERRLGSDSRVHFSAPTNGQYLVRVSDARGHGGDRYSYRLILRPAQPDFTLTLNGANPTVGPGSGQSFSVSAERKDEFQGEIRVEISGLPPGFVASSPLIIQAGHTEAFGTIAAALDAPKPEGTNATMSQIIATATVQGHVITHPSGSLGTIKLGEKPKLFVGLEPDNANANGNVNASVSVNATNSHEPTSLDQRPVELVIAPGQTLPAWLKIKRHGHDDLVTFFAENLPHGVIVADIGLSGVLIPKGENERQIFFNAARWVPEQDRLFYMIEQQAGRQTSRPILLKVRKPGLQQAAKP